MATSNLRIYLTNHSLILTNRQGFRFDFQIPEPGHVVIIRVAPEEVHIGFSPPDAHSSPSPNVSPYDPQDSSSSLSSPSDHDGQGPPPPKKIRTPPQRSFVNSIIRVSTPASTLLLLLVSHFILYMYKIVT